MNYTYENGKLTLHLHKPVTCDELFTHFHLSKKLRYLYKVEKRITCLDLPVLKDEELLKDSVSITFMKEEPDWIPSNESAEVIYEDPFILVVHKPAGIIIHGDKNDTDCLNARVARYYLDHDILSYVRPIHRLDKETSGLVLYSKISFFQPFLDEMLAEKKIYRHYEAICFDNRRIQKHFVCNASIGKDRHHSNRYRISSTGKTAKTTFDLLDRKNGYALIGCTLQTGRTHQIRVHLSSYGLYIVNDTMYGRTTRDFKAMGLWADTLQLVHPLTGKTMTIHDKPSKDYLYFNRKEI